MEVLPTLTWRRFISLLRGLSPNAATIAALNGRATLGGKEKVIEVTDRAAAQSAFEAIHAGARKAEPPKP